MLTNLEIEQIVEEVLAQLANLEDETIPLELSGRHVHLSGKDVETLFEKPLTPAQNLSQPGQYLCEERVRLIGAKGVIDNVAVLGPPRTETQVEISLTDARVLGLKAPVRQSGDIEGTPGIVLSSGQKLVGIEQGVIVAGRHIHMSPTDAARLNVKDRQLVSVLMEGTRPAIFRDVLVRVHKDFKLAMHIDFDEANGCGCGSTARCRIVNPGMEKVCDSGYRIN